MNRPPEILINSGFVTDENGVLTEMVIPNNVQTLQAPSIITTYAETINYIPSNAATVESFSAPNAKYITGNLFSDYTLLQDIRLPNLLTIGNTSTSLFANCSGLLSVDMPELLSIVDDASEGAKGCFRNCTALATINMPKLESVSWRSSWGGGAGTFMNCTALTAVSLPKIKTMRGYGNSDGNYGGAFINCTSLTSVTLGSEGHPVTSLQHQPFRGCTQSGLTITIYTAGGAALSGSPWGATNATIVYEEA